MARRRRPPAPPTPEAPEWLWQFRPKQWGIPHWPPTAEHPVNLQTVHAAKGRWREACRQWAEERGLVMEGAGMVTHLEFKRIAREEPYRVLHRPPPPDDTDA